MANVFWTEEETRTLLRLQKEGYQNVQICKIMQKTGDQVRNKLSRMGVRRLYHLKKRPNGAPVTREQLSIIREWALLNRPIALIAKEVGLAESTVCTKMRDMRLGYGPADIKYSNTVRRINTPDTFGNMEVDLRVLPEEPEPSMRFIDAGLFHCKWIRDHPRTPDVMCCGQTCLPKSPWCSHHARRAYTTEGWLARVRLYGPHVAK